MFRLSVSCFVVILTIILTSSTSFAIDIDLKNETINRIEYSNNVIYVHYKAEPIYICKRSKKIPEPKEHIKIIGNIIYIHHPAPIVFKSCGYSFIGDYDYMF